MTEFNNTLLDTRAVVVSVEYSDLLELTLAYNRGRFASTLVVTSMSDQKTVDVAHQFEADVFQTDVFYDSNAVFNKYLAIELGLEYIGRYGWLCVMDADILIPHRPFRWNKTEGNLYVPRRRIHEKLPQDVSKIPEERKWRDSKYLFGNEPFSGYCQIFHANDPVLGKGPWYETHWTWAAGPDTAFHKRWKDSKKVRPPFEVLHLGPPFVNWAGRSSAFVDGSEHPEARKRLEIVNMLKRGRRNAGGEGRYKQEMLCAPTEDPLTLWNKLRNGFH